MRKEKNQGSEVEEEVHSSSARTSACKNQSNQPAPNDGKGEHDERGESSITELDFAKKGK